MDVLRERRQLEGLLSELAATDRLVLLGDVLELRHGPVREALDVATPVLAQIGQALGPAAEVVIVPGNHDHHLLGGWLVRRASREGGALPVELASAVDWREGEALGSVACALAPARVRVSYPGIWLRNDIYATHGHYLDCHTTVPMLERLGAGAMARIVDTPPDGRWRAGHYEAVLAPLYAWIDAVAQRGRPRLGAAHGTSARAWRVLEDARRAGGLRGAATVAAFKALIATLNRTPLGPLRADISGPELRRAGLRALGEVLWRLEVRAAQVIFGHTHRAGPLPGDDRSEWVSPGGASLVNSGCWVHDPAYLGPRPKESPYRPGFAVRIEHGSQPELTNLLESPAPARA